MSKIKTRQCPACHGYGGHIEPVLDFGEGPFEPCGFCNGSGVVRGNHYFTILGWLSADSREENRLAESNMRLDAEMVKLAEEIVKQKTKDVDVQDWAQKLVDDVKDAAD